MEQPVATPTTPAGVLAAAGARVVELADTLWAARSSAELVGAIEQCEALRAQLAAVEALVLAETHARKVPTSELAWASTAEWFTHLAGTHRGEGHRTVRQAAVLVTERAATHRAMLTGRVSPEQAAVILDALDKLPHHHEVRARGEAVLLEECTRLNATDLAKAARHLVEVVDPDRAERAAERELDRADRAAHHGRFLAIIEDEAGGVRLRGRGTVEDAAALKAALLPLTKPQPQSQSQSRSGVDPDTGSENADPRDHVDPRDHGARLWDALVALAHHALATDLPPDCHGARPRIAVTTSLETLRGQIDWATVGAATTTEDGLQLTPATVRRLACDADIIPIALGTRGEVLDVGRTHRLVTPAIWRALVCRDAHCAFPGCTRPPIMCHAHHITHWAQGGHTSLPNMVLLCGHHHRTIHHTPWQVRLRPHDGRPEFLPPPRPGHPPPDWISTRPRHE